MRALIQRVNRAGLEVGGRQVAAIGVGMLILLGVEEADGDEDIDWLTGKLARLRIFPDETGVMNRSLQETGGEAMVVSQFTLFASTRKGNRPSYSRAGSPGHAEKMYLGFHHRLQEILGRSVATGIFGAHMIIDLVNDGPVTLFIDSRNRE